MGNIIKCVFKVSLVECEQVLRLYNSYPKEREYRNIFRFKPLFN